MPNFHFSLESVLRYRVQLEDQAKVELARVERERLADQARADSIRALMVENQQKLDTLSPADQGQRWLLENFIRGLRVDLHVTMQRVRNWNLLAEGARRELTKRSIEKKAMEKLKETQKKRHDYDELRKEQKEYDETSSLRYKGNI